MSIPARDLRPLFDPRSVAVVGASADTSKWGGDVAARLVGRLREALPESVGTNPVGSALGTTEPDAYARALPVVARADAVDVVVAVGQLGYWTARFPEFAQLVAAEAQGAEAMAEGARSAGKPGFSGLPTRPLRPAPVRGP